MRKLSGWLFVLSIFVLASLYSLGALADDPAQLDPGTFIGQVLDAIRSFGGLSWVGKVAIIITVIISSMKVSFLNDLVWKKLGPAVQVWVGPILGLLAGILSLALNGGTITLPAVFAYISAGAGAIILHQILDSIKAWPGLGNLWVSVIGIIEGALGGGSK